MVLTGIDFVSTDRREHHRLAIDRLVVQSRSTTGRILNLSARGLAIEISSGMMIGSTQRLLIVSPVRRVTVTASVRWCRLCRLSPITSGDVVPVFRAGLRFQKPRPTREAATAKPRERSRTEDC